MERITDDHVILLEQTLAKNREVISENQKLREELKQRDEENGRVLRDLLNTVQQLQQDNRGNSKKRRLLTKSQQKNVQVPSCCRYTLRKVFKALSEKDDFRGFHHDESVNSPSNEGALKRVKDEVYHYVGGREHCAWSDAQIDEAFKRYFQSTFETDQKKATGKYELHKQTCRRQNRKREKKARRTLALDKAHKWSTHMKGEMAEVLTEAYMSSEESEQEDGKLVYVVKTIPWESEDLKKRKRKLDRIHKKNQSKRSQDRAVKRVRKEGALSSLDRPEDCPNWASVGDTDAS